MKLDIVISGVGGQGSVLASRALALAAMSKGLAVRTSEVIGMAQREGPVTSHVRMSDELHGAIIPDRGADFLLGFELAETVRALDKLKPGGTIIASSSTIVPVSVQLGISNYNQADYIKHLEESAGRAVFIDLAEISSRAGSLKTGNVVMLGALSTFHELPFEPEQLLQAVLNSVPDRLRDVNRSAFELGRQAMEVA